jgi:predicted metal-dependent hydrolase
VDIKNGIVAVYPAGLSEKQVIRFIHEKKDWLKKVLKKHEKIKNQFTVFTHNCRYRTRLHSLTLLKHEKNTIKSLVSNHQIKIWYPAHADVTDERIQVVIRRAVIEAWRTEAKSHLPQRVKELANKFGFKYKRLTVKNAKTRWGSCSADNNINLNLQLMRLPDTLIDYVILHELCHTIHKNHQSIYWKTLEKILPGARQLDKSLNNYHLEIW